MRLLWISTGVNMGVWVTGRGREPAGIRRQRPRVLALGSRSPEGRELIRAETMVFDGLKLRNACRRRIG